MNYLNIGCGSRYHPSWINIDLISTNTNVIAHDLSTGIPLESESCEVVYHSHVLEHLSRQDAFYLLEECNRVLTASGILRVVVPDLEQVCRLYLEKLEAAVGGDPQGEADYEWIMLELLDQSVRVTSGGGMRKYLLKDQIINTDFVIQRIGDTGREILSTRQEPLPEGEQQHAGYRDNLTHRRKQLRTIALGFVERLIGKKRADAIRIGRFRLKGEIHLWMYDRYSLSKLLQEAGFSDIRVQTAMRSQIENWNDYGLDINSERHIIKPNSLFIEARKFIQTNQSQSSLDWET